MAEQAALLQRRRRGQKQKHTLVQSPVPKSSVTGSRAEVLKHIGRLNLAKRRLKLLNKFALCVAGTCMGKNIITFVSNRRRGGVAPYIGEAFQSNDARGNERRFGRLWPPLGTRGNSHPVPRNLLQPFGSYPNLLNITAAMRREFHPIVKMPLKKGAGGGAFDESEPRRRGFWLWQRRNDNGRSDDGASRFEPSLRMNEKYDYIVKDHTGVSGNDNRVLMENGERVPQLLSSREEALRYANIPKKCKRFDVGRYDEDRRGGMMYTSSLFSEGGAGETDLRTIHVGLDIGAPVGTTVFAFEEGSIHSVGYNPDVGDYGHVLVIEHHLKNHDTKSSLYALYGHLGAKSVQGKYPGQKIKKGQAIGYLGNTADNGGWTGTHVHFQLALNLPATHDMPGVVSSEQRAEALLEYVDPRYVLGELY